MIKSTIALLLISLCLSAVAQTNCEPDSPIRLSGYSISQYSIQSKLQEARKKYTDSEWDKAEKIMAECNQKMEEELREVETEISTWSLRFQEILAFKDVTGIQKQIKELRESRQKSEEELRQNLAQTKQSGLYVVVLGDIDAYADKQMHRQSAERALFGSAIEDYNGTYIKRATSVKDLKNVHDIIASMTSGEVKVVQDIHNNANFTESHFVYVAKVSVSPLKKRPIGNTASTNDVNTLVINLLTESNYESKLKRKNVREDDIKKVRVAVENFKRGVEQENKSAELMKDNILLLGNEKIKKLEGDIADAEERLNLRSKKIEGFCKKYESPFEPLNVDKSALTLLNAIKTKVDGLQKIWAEIKEREIISKTTKHFIEGDPTKSLSEESAKLIDQLNATYSKLIWKEEQLELSNYQVTNQHSSSEIILYRKIEQVWIYPIPQDDGSFRIGIFVKFNIKNNPSYRW